MHFSDDTQPRPDVAVVRGDSDRYKKRHPTPEDAQLLIEVSRSTVFGDRGEKRRPYASRGIPVYWIVNTLKPHVEVYTNPGADDYATCVIVKPGDSVWVELEGKVIGAIAVDEFMPEPEPAPGGNGP